ncbi:Rho GTPase, putative [Entamoeba invadens IP1]|uniref:small monomeric GTPase n=1 Tax=Entamoeba invadens IP1 TaxID=370355 RepID=A0A0A1UH11_ENTIV|nr:Rho GTPase, putative [Entamoeba invadens IP1]ELP94375.1 Rho GTPase, putative [Entamoeba invadens IP1]|eukprot:XP_004261146.1 Rho GTPase, putative [Entamoeba invadens IP1]
MSKNAIPIKIVLIGDGAVGKTSICLSYINQYNSKKDLYIPTVFDSEKINKSFGDQNFEITFYDTAGADEYDKLRRLSFINATVFFVCYSADSKTSFEDVKQKWLKEANWFVQNSLIVLVETKVDLRFEKSENIIRRSNFVKDDEGVLLAKQIGALGYFQTSAENNLNSLYFVHKLYTSQKRKIIKTWINIFVRTGQNKNKGVILNVKNFIFFSLSIFY